MQLFFCAKFKSLGKSCATIISLPTIKKCSFLWLLRLENSVISFVAHQDQQALQEKLEAALRKLEAERETQERHRREAQGKFEQDRIGINQLKEELNKHKARLEEAKYVYPFLIQIQFKPTPIWCKIHNFKTDW